MPMDWKKAEALIDKYWRGETTRAEEAWIKQYFSEKENKSKDVSANLLFDYFKIQKERCIEDDGFDKRVLEKTIKNPGKSQRPGMRRIILWNAAAGLALIGTLGYFFRDALLKPQIKQETVTDTYSDPEKAYEETKKALLFISSKLNEGEDYTAELSKFSEAQEKIKAKKQNP